MVSGQQTIGLQGIVVLFYVGWGQSAYKDGSRSKTEVSANEPWEAGSRGLLSGEILLQRDVCTQEVMVVSQ